MKKLLTLCVIIAMTISVAAQAPQKMSYQCVIRNASGVLVTSQSIRIRISILQGTSTGSVAYTETQTPTTNANGLVSIEIGGGTGFDVINWANGPYFLKTETDPTGGTNYTIVGTSQLLSVPYALYTKSAETATDAVKITGNQTITGIKEFYSDVLINTLTVGRGKGDYENTVVGSDALSSNTTGSFNTAIGNAVLNTNTTGSNNTVIGFEALYSNTTGSHNTANGLYALNSNTTGNSNTAIGSKAGLENMTGSYNVFLGSSAGSYETGSNKLFIDNQSRANESDARIKSLIYGVFDANPANQILTINGQVKITGGTPDIGKVLTSDATGLATWKAPSGSGHYIGESYGGGIVFYVYDNGQHGLIAATADQSTGIRWHGGSNTNTRARADGVGAGLKNTALIIANQGPVDGNAFAATVCNEYSVTVGGVTYGDWYLPSKYELNLLYLQKSVVGGFANGDYWSSTENSNFGAWTLNFASGVQGNDFSKFNAYYVRAIRAF